MFLFSGMTPTCNGFVLQEIGTKIFFMFFADSIFLNLLLFVLYKNITRQIHNITRTTIMSIRVRFKNPNSVTVFSFSLLASIVSVVAVVVVVVVVVAISVMFKSLFVSNCMFEVVLCGVELDGFLEVKKFSVVICKADVKPNSSLVVLSSFPVPTL